MRTNEIVLTVRAHVLLAYCHSSQITWFPDPQRPCSHLVIFGNPQGLPPTLPEKPVLLTSPLHLWSMQFFVLLRWEKYFAIGALYTSEILDHAMDFPRKFAKTNYSILVFQLDKQEWLWSDFCEDSLHELCFESYMFI